METLFYLSLEVGENWGVKPSYSRISFGDDFLRTYYKEFQSFNSAKVNANQATKELTYKSGATRRVFQFVRLPDRVKFITPQIDWGKSVLQLGLMALNTASKGYEFTEGNNFSHYDSIPSSWPNIWLFYNEKKFKMAVAQNETGLVYDFFKKEGVNIE